MALIDFNGFDLGDFALRSPFLSGVNSVASSRGGRSIQVDAGGLIIPIAQNTPAQEVILGCAVKLATIDATVRGHIGFVGDGNGSRHATVGLSTAGVTAYRASVGGTVLGTSPAGTVFTAGTWYYVEVRLLVSDTVGRCVVKVNGVTHVDFTGNTKNGIGSTVDTITLVANGAVTEYDDLYLCDATGSAPYNTFLATGGDLRIGTLAPTGAGASTQMAASTGTNWSCVDEQPYSATDYVTGSSAQKDTYVMADLPGSASTVLAVRPVAIAKKSDANALSLRTVVRSGGTDYAGTTTALTTADKVYATTYTTNPATSAAWTATAVNALEVGAEAV